MFISPKTAIEEGWITHPECTTYSDWVNKKFISPNAIDFPLSKLFSINESNSFRISESGKQMRGGKEIPAVLDKKTDQYYWKLSGGAVYDGMSKMYVEVPEGVTVLPMIVRSTFNRNGIFLTSGLYDSGFKGNIGFAIHNRSGTAFIGKDTRIGQIAFVKSETALMYAGGYNTSDGQHWAEK